MGPDANDEVQWIFPRVELTAMDKREVMAELVSLGVEVLFSTHVYTFGGKFYKQREGGPIGLRSTCALARVVIARFDKK